MFDIISLAGGSVIGAGIAWILECWVGLFLKQLTTEHSKGFAQPTSANNSKLFERLGIYIFMSIQAIPTSADTKIRSFKSSGLHCLQTQRRAVVIDITI